jgi:hypothetical protein
MANQPRRNIRCQRRIRSKRPLPEEHRPETRAQRNLRATVAERLGARLMEDWLEARTRVETEGRMTGHWPDEFECQHFE